MIKYYQEDCHIENCYISQDKKQGSEHQYKKYML